MKTPQRMMVILSLLLILSMVAACAQPAAETEPAQVPAVEATQPPAEEAPEPAATTAPEPTQAPVEAEKKVVTLIWLEEFDTLNTLYTNMWFVTVLYPIYACQAWWFDENNDPIPSLVTEIPSNENGGISEDGRTITFMLRDDIVWSDGTPLTSADFQFTYEMAMADTNAVSTRSPFDLVESLEIPDERTVVVTFTDPYAPWLSRLFAGQAGATILPEHILRPVFDAEGTLDTAEWNKAPTVGCGPFVFEEWESGGFARFVANENFWLGKPKVDELFFRFVPDSASQVAALVAGDGDVGTFFDYSEVPELEAAGVKIVNSFSGFNEGLFFNQHPEKGHPALKDVKVRQAIALAFNREKLVKDLLLGLTGVAATFWDNSPWADPSIEPWPFDPEQANQLLDEAGWVDSNGDGTRDKDGVELVLQYGTTTREVRQDTQAVAQQDLAAVGIGTELQSYEFDTFFASYAEDGPSANFSLDIMEWSDSPNFPDPNVVYWLCSEIPTDENPIGVNASGLCDEELDGLFQLQSTQVDLAERQQTMYQISKIMFEKVYWLGIWQDPDLFGLSDRMLNVKISGATPFFNVAEWDISD